MMNKELQLLKQHSEDCCNQMVDGCNGCPYDFYIDDGGDRYCACYLILMGIDDENIKNMKWNEFKLREMNEEEKECYSESECHFILDCKFPDDGEEILVSDGYRVWQDVFHDDGYDGCYLESIELEEGMAWMPLPKPHKKRENEE